MKKNCARAEILAGALALGEATDAERNEFRSHIAVCSSCLNAIGGEREIERTMELVSEARASEVWEPVLTAASIRRTRVARVWSVGFSTAAIAVVASLGIHFFLASQVRPLTVAAVEETSAPPHVMHITLERPAPRTAVAVAPAPKATAFEPSIVVVHNVINLKRPAQTTVVAESVPFKDTTGSNVPVWRRSEPLQTQTQVAAATTSGTARTPIMQGQSESIAVAPNYSVRDVAPLGGDTAINPRPPMIAYSLGAEGTTAFEVNVDERGVAVKCTITKSSGYLVLDRAVCKAAMAAHFSPRLVNGRAVAGIYRDAFTFRSQNNTDNQL